MKMAHRHPNRRLRCGGHCFFSVYIVYVCSLLVFSFEGGLDQAIRYRVYNNGVLGVVVPMPPGLYKAGGDGLTGRRNRFIMRHARSFIFRAGTRVREFFLQFSTMMGSLLRLLFGCHIWDLFLDIDISGCGVLLWSTDLVRVAGGFVPSKISRGGALEQPFTEDGP